MDLQQQLANALVELKNASLDIQENASEESWHDLMQCYGLLFLGGNFNTIYSVDLLHTLVNKFDMDIDIEILHELIPDICPRLGMKASPMARLEDVGKPDAPISCYSIELF